MVPKTIWSLIFFICIFGLFIQILVFYFSYFFLYFDFLKKTTLTRSEKNNDFKNSALKAKRVEKKFEI
jgi:flagellar biosynthesis protein FlhB